VIPYKSAIFVSEIQESIRKNTENVLFLLCGPGIQVAVCQQRQRMDESCYRKFLEILSVALGSSSSNDTMREALLVSSIRYPDRHLLPPLQSIIVKVDQ
jgi:hypothetical protein